MEDVLTVIASVITIVVGVIAIVAAVYSFYRWIKAILNHLSKRKVFYKNGWIKSTDFKYEILHKYEKRIFYPNQRFQFQINIENELHSEYQKRQKYFLFIGNSMIGKTHLLIKFIKRFKDSYVLIPNKLYFDRYVEIPKLSYGDGRAFVYIEDIDDFMHPEFIEKFKRFISDCIKIEVAIFATTNKMQNWETFYEVLPDKKIHLKILTSDAEISESEAKIACKNLNIKFPKNFDYKLPSLFFSELAIRLKFDGLSSEAQEVFVVIKQLYLFSSVRLN